MPVLPALSSSLPCAVTRESFQTFDEPGLSWESILAFTAILFAGMQATLMMESAEPCRASRCKIKIYLVLEILELAVAVFAEAFSFFELRSAFKVRLQWLSWLPYCLVVYGFVEILCEVVYAIYLAHRSRVKWIPFSDVDQHGNYLTRISTIIGLSISAGLSLVLVGWRQRWWMRTSSSLSTEEGIASASDEVFLSVGVMVFCTAWALFFTIFLGVLCFLFRKKLCDAAHRWGIIPKPPERKKKYIKKYLRTASEGQNRFDTNENTEVDGPSRDGRDGFRFSLNIVKIFKSILRPEYEHFPLAISERERQKARVQWLLLFLLEKTAVVEQKASESDEDFIRQGLIRSLGGRASTAQNSSSFSDQQSEMRNGESDSHIDLQKDVSSYINKVPLNVRNAIVGTHKESVIQNEEAKVLQQVLLFAKHISLLPLLICTVVAVTRLWNRVDLETLRTLKKLADVVIVISVVEIATNLKQMIWGIEGAPEPDTLNV